jgi:protein-L-isoaspartate O-methyltransferase
MARLKEARRAVRLSPFIPPAFVEDRMDDTVAKDAKRLLLRYGAPISVVDRLSDDERITYARSIIKTAVPDRPAQLRQLLSGDGRMVSR